MGKPQKVWKSGGKEDVFLKQLIKKGKITKKSKPADVKVLHPDIFGEYSLDVFRNHLNLIKRSEGLFLDDDHAKDDNEFDECFNEATSSSTPEINFSSHIDHFNYPVVVEQYKDPVTEIDVVLFCICLPGGVTNVKIDLNEDGTAVIVKYKWPDLMSKAENVFKKDLNAVKEKLENYHPKIIAYKNGLEKIRKNIDVAPESSMRINLPIPVQTSFSSWMKTGVTDQQGTLVIRAEFKGHSSLYIKKTSDMTVDFHM